MRVLFAFLLFSATFTSKAQSSIGVHASALSILGETTGGSSIGDDLGLGINIRLSAPLFCNNLEISGEASYYAIDIDYTLAGSDFSFHHTTAKQYNIGGGLTFYPFLKGKRPSMYKPFRFYISGFAGISAQKNKVIETHNMPAAYTVYDGLLIFPFGDMVAGLKIRINPTSCMDVFVGGRMALSDAVDGIAGTGAAPDMMLRIGVGICHRL